MFKRFKVREEASKNPYLQSKEYESQQIWEQSCPIYKSLCWREKGQRFSYEEKVFLYSKLIESNTDRRHMIQNFSISHSTLRNIKKELDSNIIPWNRQAM